MEQIKADKAVFIKLGSNGDWEKKCIEEGYLKLGYDDVDHDLCLQGGSVWDKEIKESFPYGNNAGAVTRHINQVRKFYEEPETTLWITFFGDCLYWCFSKPEVYLDGKAKIRPVIGQWSNCDINGKELIKGRLSGKLLTTQSFRGTICDVSEFNYLLHKINGTNEPHVQRAEDSLDALIEAVKPIIKNLHYKDLETLTDLIFRQAGWQRTGVSGEVEKDIDLDLISPLTNERIAVQVKSQANLKTFECYKKRFENMIGYSRFYFVTHSEDKKLRDAVTDLDDELMIFWGVNKLAEYSVKNGLLGWLIDKAS